MRLSLRILLADTGNPGVERKKMTAQDLDCKKRENSEGSRVLFFFLLYFPGLAV